MDYCFQRIFHTENCNRNRGNNYYYFLHGKDNLIYLLRLQITLPKKPVEATIPLMILLFVSNQFCVLKCLYIAKKVDIFGHIFYLQYYVSAPLTFRIQNFSNANVLIIEDLLCYTRKVVQSIYTNLENIAYITNSIISFLHSLTLFVVYRDIQGSIKGLSGYFNLKGRQFVGPDATF